MRGRSNADIRLDHYQKLINECILKYQNISTGLIVNSSALEDGDQLLLTKLQSFKKAILKHRDTLELNNVYKRRSSTGITTPPSRNVTFDLPGDESHRFERTLARRESAESNRNHSWVRDNIYCIMSVWGLTLAYRKVTDVEEGKAKAYELEKTVIKTMRGLLRSMMMQTEKLEKFKHSQNSCDALHAKYNSLNGKTVVGDLDWGHLQIDATSLYLLTLAQMTATGIICIFTLDEVAFIQNLVFYIETAYRTPDYGIWERGDKTNHGLPELNSSSIGLAKAALESINGLDIFGSRGGPASVIHVMPDETQQCEAILYSMLPRESISKETDAALLTVIGFPAFAVDDPNLIATTQKNVLEKLEGTYGCKRFLRDGYKTAREDPKRLHYEPWELMIFENIECQWPLFFTLLILDGLFNNKADQVEIYKQKLEDVMLISEEGIPLVPELYAVPEELVDEEYKLPHSQKRMAVGRIPHMWSQSLYILGQLMFEGYLSPGELDPLNRRLAAKARPDVIVQVIVLCEDSHIKEMMAAHGIELQTVAEAAPFHILPGKILTKIYKLQGKNKQAGLTGRAQSSEIGLLGTSQLYILCNRVLAFTPQVVDGRQFYLGLDIEYLINDFTTKIDMLRCSWKETGRPLIIYKLTRNALDNYHHPPKSLLSTIKKLQSGFISGTRVKLGNLSDFQHTSCVTRLNFLADIFEHTDMYEKKVLDELLTKPTVRSHLTLNSQNKERRFSATLYNLGISGIIRRTRSIMTQPDDSLDIFAQAVQSRRQSRYSIDYTSSFFDGNIGAVESTTDVPHHLKDDISTDAPGGMTPTITVSVQPSLHHFPERDNCLELVQHLMESDNLQEQADILHYLYLHKGLYWNTGIDENVPITIKDLLKELYDKAGNSKKWSLVRHTAGLLNKRVEDLAMAVTDLLVRQKQLSVGLPPDNEIIITRPLPPDELAVIIFKACGNNYSTASLTQELLVYLALFIRTEPRLFEEMLRLRVGLIIQLMVTELSRYFSCSGDEASDNLINLSPFEIKTLLQHILSGSESFINEDIDAIQNINDTIGTMTSKRLILEVVTEVPLNVSQSQNEISDEMSDQQGQWLRRRRLDGSLNRVPIGFYPQVWELLRRCHSLVINNNTLSGTLTREMTKQEFKFALQVDMVLNTIPQPEYRQLVVEAMMVLTILAENDGNRINLGNSDFVVDKIVLEANRIFIKDNKMPPDVVEKTAGSAGISIFFYDIAPSGRCGSMTYMVRALSGIFNVPLPHGSFECSVS